MSQYDIVRLGALKMLIKHKCSALPKLSICCQQAAAGVFFLILVSTVYLTF